MPDNNPQKIFSDPGLIKNLRNHIAAASAARESYTFMEVCGTHTQAIGKWGLRQLLPQNVRLVSGPGCPVCVTPGEYIDNACYLALEKNCIICTFGDLIRVPGNDTSLERAHGAGAKIITVYSPLDVLQVANENPDREIVFLAIGFETTIAPIAATIKRVFESATENISFYISFKLVPPALAALLADDSLNLDGFLLPGHASVIIGANAYSELETKKISGVVAGFEPVDILAAIDKLTEKVNNNDPTICNLYPRVVSAKGNLKAQSLFNELFNKTDTVWRGIGTIPKSGYALKENYRQLNAETKFDLQSLSDKQKSGCRCGDVLKGLIIPPDCPLFGNTCNPINPVGPCMVSGEGSCAAHYKYER